MASYSEIYDIVTDTVPGAQTLRQKVTVAGMIIAYEILSGNDIGAPYDSLKHDQRVKWAVAMLASPLQNGTSLFRVIVAANDGIAQSTILAASDNAILSNAKQVIDSLSANL